MTNLTQYRASVSALIALLSLVALIAPASGAAAVPTGRILCAYWREVPGSQIADLLSQPTYPDFPDEQIYLDRFEIAENQEGNFATVIRGFVHPPADGDYIFSIAGNNQCELYLSADADPAGKKLIASVPQWSMPRDFTASPEQQSKPIRLKAGTACYIEARHKNGGGDNHLCVAWKLPDGTTEFPIPGQRLSPAESVNVPPPQLSLPSLPSTAGAHRLAIPVDYLTHKFTLPVLLTLPEGYDPARKYPVLVFLPDTDQEPDAQGFRLQGPDRPLPAISTIRRTLPFIGISPQCPADHSYDQRVTIKALSATISQLCARYPADRDHITLTGTSTGATASWRLALDSAHTFSAIAPICSWQVTDPRLLPSLQGTRVHIITDIGEGFATECANRMQAALAGLQPASDVVYLGPKELVNGASAANYCYSQSSFYTWLLVGPATDNPPQPTFLHRHRIAAIAALTFVALVFALIYIRRHRCTR